MTIAVPIPPGNAANPRRRSVFVERFGHFLDAAEELAPDEPLVGVDQVVASMAAWLRYSPAGSASDLRAIARRRPTVLAVLRIAAMSSRTFFAQAFGPFTSVTDLASQSRTKLSLLAATDSVSEAEMLALRDVDQLEAVRLLLHVLVDEPLTDTEIAVRRAAHATLIDSKAVTLPLDLLGPLSSVYFLAGYGVAADKYLLRPVLAALTIRMLAAAGFESVGCAAPRPDGSAARPKALVVAEHFHWGNDLTRCFAAAIESLKERFDVTLIADTSTRHPAHAGQAHTVRYVDSSAPQGLAMTVAAIAATAPDVIFYPSIAMTPWSYALAHLRLAPIQVVSTGTPGPIGSPTVDRQAMQRQLAHPASTRFEPVVPFDAQPQGEGHYDPSRFREIAATARRSRSEGCVVIGINSSFPKLNAPFLAAVRRIAEESARPVALEFFPSRSSLQHQAARARIVRELPGAVVHPQLVYPEYLRRLARCDLILQSFPFGGTNTTIEALLLGVPILCLSGPETHSAVDVEILRRWQLDDTLLAASVADYVSTAVRLVADGGLRRSIGDAAFAHAAAALASVREGTTLGDALFAVVSARGAIPAPPPEAR